LRKTLRRIYLLVPIYICYILLCLGVILLYIYSYYIAIPRIVRVCVGRCIKNILFFDRTQRERRICEIIIIIIIKKIIITAAAVYNCCSRLLLLLLLLRCNILRGDGDTMSQLLRTMQRRKKENNIYKKKKIKTHTQTLTRRGYLYLYTLIVVRNPHCSKLRSRCCNVVTNNCAVGLLKYTIIILH